MTRSRVAAADDRKLTGSEGKRDGHRRQGRAGPGREASKHRRRGAGQTSALEELNAKAGIARLGMLGQWERRGANNGGKGGVKGGRVGERGGRWVWRDVEGGSGCWSLVSQSKRTQPGCYLRRVLPVTPPYELQEIESRA